MSDSSRVYCYTNLVTGQKYIGCTCIPYQSSRAGKNGCRYRSCPLFWGDIQKYGWGNFKYEVIEDGLTKEEAFLREQYWIAKLNTLYPFGLNSQSGGKNGMRQSDDTKQKFSEMRRGEGNAFYGKHHTEKTKEKLRVSHTGVHLSDETKKKLSDSLAGNKNPMYGVHRYGEDNPFYGKHHSDESKQRMSESRRK